jgi:4-azaleucine resistance transporter AzlC
MVDRKPHTNWNWPLAITAGVRAAWPIYLGYLPIGIALGVLAQQAGLSAVEIGLMSFLVFAGSSQFIAVSMLSMGAGASAIVATTFIVNLRHVLFSSSLAPHLNRAGLGRLSLVAFGITDESFAVNHTKFSGEPWSWKPSLVVNQTSWAVWIVCTVAGAWVGRFIPHGAFGIDYALVAMFLCLLVFQLRGRRYTLTAVTAGVLSVILSLLIPGNSYVVIASIPATVTGTLLARKKRPLEK